VTQREYRTLPAVEAPDGCGQPCAPLAGEQPPLGVGVACLARRESRLVHAGGFAGRRKPAIAPCPRLAAIEATVDEDSRELDLERPRVAIRVDVGEHLDERILDGFVGFRGIAQVLVRDPQGPPLMSGDKAAKPFARFFGLASRDELPDLDRQARIVTRDRRRERGVR
jgi:hypothetical protein